MSGYDKDILMVTHSRDEIYRFCEHMLIVEDGRQAGFGITKEIFKNPRHTGGSEADRLQKY